MADELTGAVKPVDVSFEFFDPQSQDYEAIKRLLIQLFGPDAQTLQIDGLVDLILAQGTIGSTVKVDGHESDPYAILTVLNLSQAEEPTLINLKEYFWQKVNHSKTVWSSPSGSRRLQQLLKTSTSKVGLVMSERLVNMPVQILPPMLDMLQEEIEWAVADKESYQFDWWLVPTRVYQCVQSALGEDDGVEGQSKSQKKKKAKQRHASKEGLESTGGSKFESFHPEDEIISKVGEKGESDDLLPDILRRLVCNRDRHLQFHTPLTNRARLSASLYGLWYRPSRPSHADPQRPVESDDCSIEGGTSGVIDGGSAGRIDWELWSSLGVSRMSSHVQ